MVKVLSYFDDFKQVFPIGLHKSWGINLVNCFASFRFQEFLKTPENVWQRAEV